MNIVTEEQKQKARNRRRVRSLANVSKKPGKQWLILNPHGHNGQDTPGVVDGEAFVLKDHVGSTEDREFAAAAASHGYHVIEREKHFAKGTFTMTVPDLPWKRTVTPAPEFSEPTTSGVGDLPEGADDAHHV